MTIVVLIALLIIAAVIVGGLNRDYWNRQSLPGEEWSRDPTGNIPRPDSSYEKPGNDTELL